MDYWELVQKALDIGIVVAVVGTIFNIWLGVKNWRLSSSLQGQQIWIRASVVKDDIEKTRRVVVAKRDMLMNELDNLKPSGKVYKLFTDLALQLNEHEKTCFSTIVEIDKVIDGGKKTKDGTLEYLERKRHDSLDVRRKIESITIG